MVWHPPGDELLFGYRQKKPVEGFHIPGKHDITDIPLSWPREPAGLSKRRRAGTAWIHGIYIFIGIRRTDAAGTIAVNDASLFRHGNGRFIPFAWVCPALHGIRGVSLPPWPGDDVRLSSQF